MVDSSSIEQMTKAFLLPNSTSAFVLTSNSVVKDNEE